MTETILSLQPKIYKPMRARLKRWTRAEYDLLVMECILTERDKVELIEGEIIEKMPLSPLHTTATLLTQEILSQVKPKDCHVRIQMPLDLGIRSEPEPDVAVVHGVRRDYSERHPQTALLIVEIADESLDFDRNRKARMYSKAGIADYWIVNINERVVEVYRDPIKVNGRGRYQTQLRFSEGESITPLAFDNAAIAVNEILP